MSNKSITGRIGVRVTPETHAQLLRLAKSRGLKLSAVVREALEQYVDEAPAPQPAQRRSFV